MNQTILLTLSPEDLRSIIETSLSKYLPGQQNQQISDDTLLNTKEAADLINYKETSIYGLVKRKKIPHCKVEGKLLFSKRDLMEWVKSKKLDVNNPDN